MDVTKEELRERLRQGKVSPPQQTERALSAFFTSENLSFLRELCLRGASGEQVRKIEAQELLRIAIFGNPASRLCASGCAALSCSIFSTRPWA